MTTDDKIAELERLLAERASAGQDAVRWANRAMYLLDCVLEEVNSISGGSTAICTALEKREKDVMRIRPMKFLALYGIERFKP